MCHASFPKTDLKLQPSLDQIYCTFSIPNEISTLDTAFPE